MRKSPTLEELALEPDPASPHQHDAGLLPGEECPACHRRVPRPKQPESPSSKVISFRVPEDEVESFLEVVEAAAEHTGSANHPYAKFRVMLRGMVLILQEPQATFEGG